MPLLRSTLALALVACGATPVPILPATVPTHVVAEPPPAVAAVVAADPVSPLDPNIKRGTLPNGLTYYVVKHAKPEQRAALWLAVDAGAVLEDEDQRGLAHFVEHMAFNGTRRFPKQQIVDFIEKAGMRFGADVNAYTGFDQTVYQLMVPTDDAPVMMKGLDILRDWAGDITFDPVEVDKERGVVLEEWRLGRGADARIFDKQFPIILAGSRYGERLPIGLPAVLKTAPRAALARFYKDWYQPQHMAVIAIGDFEPQQVEAAIVARFGDLQATPDARPRTAVPVPREHPTLITIETDKEMPTTSIAVYDKLEHRRETTKGDYRRFIVESLYHAMLNARFAELAEEPDAPFLSAGSSTGGFVRTSDTFSRFASAKQGRVEETLTVLFRELARVEQHGFLPSELARAVRAQLASAESSAAEWDKTPSPELADEVTRNFFEGEQMPGRVVELAYERELIPTITLAELDQLAKTWGGQAGRVVAIQGRPQGQPGARLPTVDEVRALIAATATTTVAPWQDDGGDRPLMTTTPAAGKVVATTRDATSDVTTWTLANGVRVLVKPTTFQNDEVMLGGYLRGGSSRVADQDYVQARFAADIVSASGVGDLDAKALRKVLAGKQAYAVVGL
ncbi:MAG: pitrilysin family protein, partial [Proteobacteria bacterium]|nr:pitrilysin family protein [Pseudomonadota bacterium]